MTTFSSKVEEMLTKAGWSPTRKVDTSLWVNKITECALPPSEHCIKFLENFGGLRIDPFGKRIPGYGMVYEFDPIKSLNAVDKERLSEYFQITKYHVYPVGKIIQDADLLIDDKWRMHFSPDGDLYLTGETLNDFFEMLDKGNLRGELVAEIERE